MPIDFHAEGSRYTYASRQADLSWVEQIQKLVDLRGKKVVDIGCGGGIYSTALAELGASQVTGVDFSQAILKGASEHCQGYEQIDFVQGNALETGLPAGQYDLVLQRALIHHLPADQLLACFAESFRLLKPGGVLLVQNRTPEDCLLPGSEHHIRGYFFERYPRLCAEEVTRRHSSEAVQSVLTEVGYAKVEEIQFRETRRVHASLQQLESDLLARTGRSILHSLSDAELQDLVAYIGEQVQVEDGQEIVEQDRWTIWLAVKA